MLLMGFTPMSNRKVTRVKIDDVPALNLIDFQDLDEALMNAELYYKEMEDQARRALINLADGKVNVRHQYGLYRTRIVRVLGEGENA